MYIRGCVVQIGEIWLRMHARGCRFTSIRILLILQIPVRVPAFL